jgi:hypothetical protein
MLSTIKGPWALIYWQAGHCDDYLISVQLEIHLSNMTATLNFQMDSNILWFGRDAFGRRSLLVHWPTADDSRFILSSVSPPSFAGNHSGKISY